MTAILQNLRQLDAARKAGAITQAQYEEIKWRMLNAVEDAEELPPSGRAPQAERRSGKPSPTRAAMRPEKPPQGATTAPNEPPLPNLSTSSLLGLVLVVLGVGAVGTLIMAKLIGDITIALTLALTVAAAVLVSAAKRLQL